MNSGDIPDVDKWCQDKCCMDKCHHDLGYVRLSCGWVGVLTEIIRGCQKALGSVKFLLFGWMTRGAHTHFFANSMSANYWPCFFTKLYTTKKIKKLINYVPMSESQSAPTPSLLTLFINTLEILSVWRLRLYLSNNLHINGRKISRKYENSQSILLRQICLQIYIQTYININTKSKKFKKVLLWILHEGGWK